MPVEVIFPKVDMDMDSGVLSEWLCTHGDSVEEGQPIFVIETDKSAMEIEAAVAGRIAIGESAAGTEHRVGKVLAHIYDSDEEFGGLASDTVKEQIEVSSQLSSQVSPHLSSQLSPDLSTEETVNTSDAVAAEQTDRRRFRASPAARRIAAEYNIPLSAVAGSAPKGRIVKADDSVFV